MCHPRYTLVAPDTWVEHLNKTFQASIDIDVSQDNGTIPLYAENDDLENTSLSYLHINVSP